MSELAQTSVENDAESRVLLSGIPWNVYVALRDSIESGGVKVTYLEGDLEITSPSRRHEVENTMIGRLLELFALEKDIPLYGYGSMTMRKRLKKRGLEPDKCYCRDFDRERPQLAIEIVISSPLLDKLEVYRGLGIGEVWTLRSGRIHVQVLKGGKYREVATSVLFPELDLNLLAQFAVRSDQHPALREFRDRIRGH